MDRRLAVAAALTAATAAFGQDAVNSGERLALGERETLSDQWFGFGRRLDDRGVRIDLGLTQISQANTRGGLNTAPESEWLAGSYDLELNIDLARLVGIKGGRIYGLAEGGWADGVDPASVGSLLGVNDDARGDHLLDITELWYEQSMLDGRLLVRVGKVDLTAGFESDGRVTAFDRNAFANDETAQFLNSSLVNNPAVPFPGNGFGVALQARPVSWSYLAAGTADAGADQLGIGPGSVGEGDADLFSVVEAGLTPEIPSPRGPLPGACRIGLWFDPRPKDRFGDGGTKRDDSGIYLSADQMLFRESTSEDVQGLGIFARYGHADEDVSEIASFWSAGAQYLGPIPGRDGDVLAAGIAQGILSDAAGFTASHETVVEIYYSAAVAGWLSVTPSVQFVRHPGGDRNADDAIVIGLRLQMAL
jgi:porin